MTSCSTSTKWLGTDLSDTLLQMLSDPVNRHDRDRRGMHYLQAPGLGLRLSTWEIKATVTLRPGEVEHSSDSTGDL